MKYKEGDLVITREASRDGAIKVGDVGKVLGVNDWDVSRIVVDFNGHWWTNMKEEQLDTPTKLQKLLKEEP